MRKIITIIVVLLITYSFERNKLTGIKSIHWLISGLQSVALARIYKLAE